MTRILSQLLGAVLLAWGCLAAAAPSPVPPVERIQQALTQSAEDIDSRYQTLRPVVEETHDFATIARISAGSHWRTFSAEQRERFVDAVTRLSAATYAKRFPGSGSTTFSEPSVADRRDNRAIVRAQLTKADGETIPFEYMLSRTEEGWRIVNVTAKGVSDLAVRRAEYTSILEREGYEALLEQLREKITDYREAEP